MNSEEILDFTLQLSSRTIQLRQQLQNQSYQLRRIGVGVPKQSLSRLQSIQEELHNLGERIQSQKVELMQLRTLASTTEWINSSLDLDEVLNQTMDRVLQITGAERGYIMLMNPETQELEPRVARSMPDSMGQHDETFIISQTIIERTVEQGETIITTNAREDSRFMSQDSIIGYALRSIICVPLTSRERVIGAVYCDNRFKDGLFGKREQRLLVGFANQAAIAIDNAQLFEQLTAALADITEIKVLLDNILASILSGVITTDANGQILTFNAAAGRIFGVKAHDAIHQWIGDVLASIYQEIEPAIESARTENAVITVETDVAIDERGVLNLKLKISPLKDETSHTQGIALVVDDLTELNMRDATLAAVRRYLPPAMVDNIRSIQQLGFGGNYDTITVMFVEVRSFDSFPKELSPRELMELLNIYHTLGSEAIHTHAGLIDKYMGNEIMSLFNSQLNPSEQHAWDAVQAALRMAADFRTMGAFGDVAHLQSDIPYYRIGIHSGPAVLGNVGSPERREFSAIGDTVNLAKRLQENAETGQIIITENVLSACADAIAQTDWLEVRELPAMVLKGISRTIRIFELYDRGTE